MKTRICEKSVLGKLHIEVYDFNVAKKRKESLLKAGFKQIDKNQTLYPMTFNAWDIK